MQNEPSVKRAKAGEKVPAWHRTHLRKSNTTVVTNYNEIYHTQKKELENLKIGLKE